MTNSKAMPAAAVGGHLMHVIFVLFQALILVILDGEQSLFLNKRERVREFYVVSVVLLCCILCWPSLSRAIACSSKTKHHKTKKQSNYNKKKDTHDKELVANLLLLA